MEAGKSASKIGEKFKESYDVLSSTPNPNPPQMATPHPSPGGKPEERRALGRQKAAEARQAKAAAIFEVIGKPWLAGSDPRRDGWALAW